MTDTNNGNTAAQAAVPDPSNKTASAGSPGGRKLTEVQKAYVVRRLAAFDRPFDIVKDLREKFGVAVSRQSIERYDPTRSAECPQRWRKMFFDVRRAMTMDSSDQSEPMTPSRRRERVLLNAVEALADRILESMSGSHDGIVAKAPEQVTDEDRISALSTFIDKLRSTNPAAFARIRAALNESVQWGDESDV